MHLTSTVRQGLAIGGVSVLAVVGLIGWTRGNSARSVGAMAPSLATYSSDPEPVASTPDTRRVYAASPFGDDAFPVPSPSAVAFSAAPQAPIVRTAVRRQTAVARRSRAQRRRTRVIIRRRPFRRSAAIVGGSAAGGALVGALAGGGKGAAIGALAGGGGGLVYDRLTHKKRVVVRR